MRWVMLGIYFAGVFTVAYNSFAYASIGKSLGKSMGFLMPDGKTGDSFYIDINGTVNACAFVPASFLSFYLLERKGIRLSVRVP